MLVSPLPATSKRLASFRCMLTIPFWLVAMASGMGCQVGISIEFPAHKETMRWLDLWAAAVAVDASKPYSTQKNTTFL